MSVPTLRHDRDPTVTETANRLARVFPRRTKAAPDDALAFVGSPDLMDLVIAEGVDEVHVSVAFTADKAIAERLAQEWSVLRVPVRENLQGAGRAAGQTE